MGDKGDQTLPEIAHVSWDTDAATHATVVHAYPPNSKTPSVEAPSKKAELSYRGRGWRQAPVQMLVHVPVVPATKTQVSPSSEPAGQPVEAPGLTEHPPNRTAQLSLES